jgi:hypothetical protein
MQNVIRTLLFVVFFSMAGATLSISVLCDDLVRYYQNKHFLKTAEQSLGRLKSLNADYDALLESIEKDPELLKRIAPATLGVSPADPNVIYPKVQAEQLAAARKALSEDAEPNQAEPKIPKWLERCSSPRRRGALFAASAALIVVSFTCFRPVKQIAGKQQQTIQSAAD